MSAQAEVSERLKQFENMVCPVNGLFVSRFDTQLNLVQTNAPNQRLITTIFLLGTDGNPQKLAAGGAAVVGPGESAGELDGAICMFTNRWGLAWISEVRVESGCPQEILVLGPVFLSRYSRQEMEDELHRLQLSLTIRRAFIEEISRMPVISLNRFYEYGIMFHYCITGKQIQVSDFQYPQEQPETEDWEFEPSHEVNYELEQQMMKLIEDGNMNFQKEFSVPKLSADWDSGESGELLVQARNMVVMNATLASRAAIRGGMSPQTSLSLRVSFIHEVGRAKTLGAVNEINTRMINTYIKRVHMLRIQSGVSPQIQRCCDYISANLSERVEIHDLAQMVGYTDYYFSKKFKKEVGAGVKEYIAQKKIETAKEYLRNTSMRVNEIAEALGYVNQGYFSDVFRRSVGVSPTEYRSGAGERFS